MPTPQAASAPATPLVPLRMTQLDTPAVPSRVEWLWHGLIARGNVTFFTSQWKAGKTTLLTGLMQQMAKGGKFLERPSRSVVVTVSPTAFTVTVSTSVALGTEAKRGRDSARHSFLLFHKVNAIKSLRLEFVPFGFVPYALSA